MNQLPLKAIIIDDEAGAREILCSLLQKHCAGISIAAQAGSVPEGVLAINKHQPDVVFLDVEMPEYNGFELLDFIKEVNFEIVFVTAYSHHAIRAFEVSAVDYLLKPVEPESLQHALEKVRQKKQYTNIQPRLDLMQETRRTGDINRIAVPMNDGLMFIDIDDVVMFEAERAYSYIYLNNGSRILVSKPMCNFEELLDNRPLFFRPHRSYLININFIKKYQPGLSNIIMQNNMQVAVARDRKPVFESLLKELRLSV